jgi:hypothetical protein
VGASGTSRKREIIFRFYFSGKMLIFLRIAKKLFAFALDGRVLGWQGGNRRKKRPFAKSMRLAIAKNATIE